MRIIKFLVLVCLIATGVGCGDSKTPGPASLTQEKPKTGKGGIDKSMKKIVER